MTHGASNMPNVPWTLILLLNVVVFIVLFVVVGSYVAAANLVSRIKHFCLFYRKESL